jgi:hypothetical protein
MKYNNVFFDGDLIPSKPKNFDCDSCTQSKSTHQVPKTFQDHVKSKFDVIHSDIHRFLAIQSVSGNRYCVTFIDKFRRYTSIYFVQCKSDVKTVFQTFYNLVEIQFSGKIKKLKIDNGDQYVNIDMSGFLEMKGIIHDLSPLYAHQCNGSCEHMKVTIVTIVSSVTLDSADVIPQVLCTEVCSIAIHIKNHLPHSAFKLNKSPSEIMFGDKPSIKHLYPFGAKCYVHIPEENQIGTSKLSPRGIKSYVVGYTESSEILRLYDPKKHRVYTSRVAVFPDSTKRCESTEIESPTDPPLNLDNNTPWTIEQKRDLWEWIVKNLDDAIARAKNGNRTLCKFIHFRPHKDNHNLGLSDNDQELLDKLKIPDFIEKEKSKSPTPPPNPSGSLTSYKKPIVEIPPVNID